jgi:predicted RNase H-like nuclease (RuvC/YqgF family)
MKKKHMSEINQLKVDLRNKTLMYENQKKVNIELKEEIKELKKENSKLKILAEELLNKFKTQDDIIRKLNTTINKLEKNSTNSSKPPSTDIVKKNKSLRKK